MQSGITRIKPESGIRSLYLPSSFAFDNNNIFPLQLPSLYHCQQFRERAALDFLEEFSQVVGEGGVAVAEDGQGVFEEGGETIGAFIEDQRVGRVEIDGEEFAPSDRLVRGKAAKGETVNGQAGEDNSHHQRGGAGDQRHLDTGANSPPYQREAGIRNARRPRVGDEANRLALLQQVLDALTGLLLIMFMKGDLRL